ncbi:MAG: indolepyruvate ferredoxin oxidoreductase family protein, partial [Arenicella sp.]|nr:indolepyruvate ferredoxin oxidoreductase family protein [Arenicella sp.]
YGFELSRYCGCWVGLKAITENMDSAISAEINPGRIEIKIPEDFEMPHDGVNVRWPDAPLAQEERLNKYKIYAARAFALENDINRIVIDSQQPRLGIITSGKSYLDVLQAFEDLGLDEELVAEIGIRVYKVGMPWPLEPVKTHEFARGLDEILVVEEKRSVIEDQLTGQLYNWPVGKRPRVVGEYDEEGNDLLTNLGELSPAMIARAIAQRVDRFYTSATIQERISFINSKEQALAKPRKLSEREPAYCSGCPHNTSTKVPEGSIAGGGIGCHYMSTWSKTRPAHNFTQMGGEGVTWTGMAPFTETQHMFQNLGDGTYAHSGILAIRQSVAAKVNITYKILYNDAVAMTGGQPVDGTLSLPELILQLRGEGVGRIEIVSDQPDIHRHLANNVVTVSHRDQLNAIQKSLRETPGTTVLIYEQTCATEKRRRRKRGLLPPAEAKVFINDAVCEGCGDCSVKSNCLSVIPKETELGRKRQIDQAACNQDYSCVNGFCPSFVTVVGGEMKKGAGISAAELSDTLPQPQLPEIEQPWNVLVTGVGGTGVLTVAAVLSMAAHLEDKGVATMNQTGLAQKFGPVVSHLRIAKRQRDIHAVRIPAGDADLVIGCDLLVSAGDDALAKLHQDRSYAVINDTVAVTAEFVNNPDAVFHIEPMKQSIRDELSQGMVDFLPATDIALALLGDTIATNLFMVGYAYQKGMLPVSSEAIEKALEINNVAVEFNKQAFLWGRLAAHDEAQVREISQIDKNRLTPLSGLDEIVDYRSADLAAYQNAKYADTYRQRVESVKAREREILGDNSNAFSIAFAKALHRVMAYKDEYEVARLYSDGRFQQQLKSSFSGDYKLQLHMAPPLLSRRDPDTGHLIKRQFGSYILPVFGLLARLKGLRGTAFDIFGYSAERRMERQLIDEVCATADTLLGNLSEDNLDHAMQIMNFVLDVRGYGHVKQANYQQYQLRLSQQLKRYHGQAVLPVEVAHVA